MRHHIVSELRHWFIRTSTLLGKLKSEHPARLVLVEASGCMNIPSPHKHHTIPSSWSFLIECHIQLDRVKWLSLVWAYLMLQRVGHVIRLLSKTTEMCIDFRKEAYCPTTVRGRVVRTACHWRESSLLKLLKHYFCPKVGFIRWGFKSFCSQWTFQEDTQGLCANLNWLWLNQTLLLPQTPDFMYILYIFK